MHACMHACMHARMHASKVKRIRTYARPAFETLGSYPYSNFFSSVRYLPQPWVAVGVVGWRLGWLAASSLVGPLAC